MHNCKLIVAALFLSFVSACTWDDGTASTLPIPIIKEVAVNEHASIGVNDGTDDAIDMSSITIVSTSTQKLLADVGFFIDADGSVIALSTEGLGTNVNETHQTWIQAIPGSFGAEATAPTTGWGQAQVRVDPNQILYTKLLRLPLCGADTFLYRSLNEALPLHPLSALPTP